MNITCLFRTWPYSCIWLCNTLPRASKLESHHQMWFSVTPRTLPFLFFRRGSLSSVLGTQSANSEPHEKGSFKVLYIYGEMVDFGKSDKMKNTRIIK